MMKKVLLLFSLILAVEANALDVLFRYDDYRLIDNALQNELIEIFAEEHVPLHVAIIPFNRDTTPCLQEGRHLERFKELQRCGILQLALHGCFHVGNPGNGEFYAIDPLEQRFRLVIGSQLLDSVFNTHVHVFIPPWNMYSQTTLDVLAELKYNIISASMSSELVASDSRFQYYPETVEHPSELPAIVSRQASREGLVVCMFHAYDFSDSFTMNDLRTVLREVKANPNVHIATMDELYVHDKSFNASRIEANRHQPLLTKLLKTRQIIQPIPQMTCLRLLDLLLHMLLVIIIALIGTLLIKHAKKYYWCAQFIMLLFAGLQTWFQFVKPKYGIVVITLMTLLVIVCSYIKQSRKNGK